MYQDRQTRSTTFKKKHKFLQHRNMAQKRKPIQLRGGHRLSGSIRLRTNRLEFDHTDRTIFEAKKAFKVVSALTKKKTRVVAKMDEIDHVQLGMQSANFIELRNLIEQGRHYPVSEEQCLSIIFKNELKTIDLIAPNKIIRDRWHLQLLSVIEHNRYWNIKHNFDQFLIEQFHKADLDRNGSISYEEVVKLLRKLNIVFDENETKMLFEKANYRKSYDGAESLDQDEFIEFYNLISYTKVLDQEFKRFTGESAYFMTFQQVYDFMRYIQKVDLEELEKYTHQLIAKYEPLQANKTSDANHSILSSKGFRNLLLSTEFSIRLPKTFTVNQDMSRPLVEYFIATSHNTYLSHDQLEGRSTTETYRLYLSQGCRSVELDISDGDESSNFEPVVFHKRTLTSKVKLSDIVNTIVQYAFRTSPYPVIISLENNCKSLDSQRRAAAIFRTHFGDHLLTIPLRKVEQQMPSPKELMNKIIIKGKRLPLQIDSNVAELEKKHKLAKELSDLVWYATSRKFTTFATKNWNYNEMTSIEEGLSKKLSKKQCTKYRLFTSQYLTKVYPFGLRFFSGNYNPIPHWNAGAQMVSLNYQTKSNPFWLNKALFEINGSCGYVLKPPHLTYPQRVYRSTYCQVQLTILCAMNLPSLQEPIINPYVRIKIFGCQRYKRRIFRTNTVRDNGLNPQWGRKFEFKISSSESSLVFFRFQVCNGNVFKKNVLVAFRMIAFDSIAEGYRNIPLHDAKDKALEQSKLVVHINKIWLSDKQAFINKIQ